MSVLIVMLLAACAATPPPDRAVAPAPAPIVDVATPTQRPAMVHTPITWDAERDALTRAYRSAHQALPVDSSTIAPQIIVLHWTAGTTFASAFATFNPVRLAGRADIADAGALNVSAHFVVDRDGTIHQLLPTTTMARHVIGLNHVAIGIENVGGTPDTPLTDAQRDANVVLVRWLADEHAITHLIGHHEYRDLEGSALFDEVDDAYRTVKSDPGDDFMRQVRERVAELGLQSR